jgi:hypothetical protein
MFPQVRNGCERLRLTAVIAGRKWILRIANAVDVIKSSPTSQPQVFAVASV